MVARGKAVFVKKVDVGVNAITVARQGGATYTIQGAASTTLATQYASVLLHNDGESIWYIASTI